MDLILFRIDIGQLVTKLVADLLSVVRSLRNLVLDVHTGLAAARVVIFEIEAFLPVICFEFGPPLRKMTEAGMVATQLLLEEISVRSVIIGLLNIRLLVGTLKFASGGCGIAVVSEAR